MYPNYRQELQHLQKQEQHHIVDDVNDIKASKLADEPEFTSEQYFILRYSLSFFSNSSV